MIKIKPQAKKTVQRTAVDGILAAVALTLSFFESLLPSVSFLPPGAKLGLANIAVMFAVIQIGAIDGIIIVLIKSGFVFLTRGPAAFFMSISGSILSCLVLIAAVQIAKKAKKELPYTGISVICAVTHNIGQTFAASIYTQTNLVTSYIPVLLITGVVAGIITGVVLTAVMPALTKTTKPRG